MEEKKPNFDVEKPERKKGFSFQGNSIFQTGFPLYLLATLLICNFKNIQSIN